MLFSICLPNYQEVCLNNIAIILYYIILYYIRIYISFFLDFFVDILFFKYGYR
jgi:hypothetical protein